MEKVKVASAKFDKTHPAAPSTAGFTGGAMKPGEFRELVRRTFNLWLKPQELAAIVHNFPFDAERKSGKLDSKAFLIKVCVAVLCTRVHDFSTLRLVLYRCGSTHQHLTNRNQYITKR